MLPTVLESEYTCIHWRFVGKALRMRPVRSHDLLIASVGFVYMRKG